MELQLVCHFLSAADILRLGRCTRRMRQVIDSPFAWRACQMVTVVSTSELVLSGSVHPLRHAAVCVRWAADSQGEVARWESIAAFAERLNGRLHALDASALGASDVPDWQEVLSHHCVQQLRVLRLHRVPYAQAPMTVSKADIDLICGLPLLHTLEILHANINDAECWESLPLAPSLRCLTICDPALETSSASTSVAYAAAVRVARIPQIVSRVFLAAHSARVAGSRFLQGCARRRSKRRGLRRGLGLSHALASSASEARR